MESMELDPTGRLLEAFGTALIARDHEALDVQLAPWISVASALALLDHPERSGRDIGFELLPHEAEFAEVADVLPARIDEGNFDSWSTLAFYRPVPGGGDGLFSLKLATVTIAGGLYIGHIEAED